MYIRNKITENVRQCLFSDGKLLPETQTPETISITINLLSVAVIEFAQWV